MPLEKSSSPYPLKNIFVLCALFFAFLFSAASAYAQTGQTLIGVQLNSDSLGFSTGTAAGVVPESTFTWNSDETFYTPGAYGTTGTSNLYGLIDSNNNGTNINESTVSNGSYGPNNAAPHFANQGDNDLMSYGYFASGFFSLSLSDLTEGQLYDLIIYVISTQSTYGPANVTATTSASNLTYFFSNTLNSQNTQYILASSTSSKSFKVANYVEWNNLAADDSGDISATLTAPSGFNVAGFELVELPIPEPSECAFFGIGAIGLTGLAIRRRRVAQA
jgi:hypothetical protein